MSRTVTVTALLVVWLATSVTFRYMLKVPGVVQVLLTVWFSPNRMVLAFPSPKTQE